MNNKDNYKNAINQIHASEDLKSKTLENMTSKKSNNYSLVKFLSTCAAVFLVCVIGVNSLYNNENMQIAVNPNEDPIVVENPEKEVVLANADLPRFKNIEELKEALKTEYISYDGIMKGEIALEESVTTNSAVQADGAEMRDTSDLASDFSTTNTQVENVDEADIVKTDGKYIYYTTNNVLYIVEASNLEIISTIKLGDEKERFYISEIFLKGNKLVLIGNSFIIERPVVAENETTDIVRSYVYVNTKDTVNAVVFDISDKSNPKEERNVALEGNYVDSRMVGDNLYLISRNYKYYYDGMKDVDILPVVNDSVVAETKTINCTDIIHFGGTEDTSFMMVGGFNINDDEEVYVETFFGAGNTVYANENKLYLTRQLYGDETRTVIYKFKLDGAKINLLAQGEVKGYLNNQFSIDEYDGNLRVATTSYEEIKPQVDEYLDGGIIRTTMAERESSNNLFILDENLKEISKIENLARDEKIYSVRFIGKIGYIVTFKEIDPLFVIDLSDPTNPVVKGELKIPGYSSYLHPYDETHIIGIGYNTKDNGWGGVTNSNMKMSMFDVSDLENPVELFNVDIGTENAYSEVTHNHKVLFYKKAENLIGFPVTYRDYDYRNDRDGFVIFRVDLENNQFEKYGEILQEINYRTNIRRIIYIEDVVYTLSDTQIVSYDLNTFEKLKEVVIEPEDEEYEYMTERVYID